MAKRRRKTKRKKGKHAGKTIKQLKRLRSKHGSKTKAYARLSGAIARKRRK